MNKEEDFKLLKIQTCVLKVNIHCDGCKQKVKKLLQKIEGVYKVDVDSEQQKVTVSGNVDSSTLIKKLLKGGKYGELWSQKSNQNHKSQQTQFIKDDKNSKDQREGLMKGLKAFKNQQNLPFSLEGHGDCEDYGDDYDYDHEEDEELRIFKQGLLGQANDANLKKAIAAAAANNNKAGHGGANGNVGKKDGVILSQNAGGQPNHKNINFAASTHLGGGMIGNSNGAEGKKINEINGFGLGFHGHGAGVGAGAGLAGNGLGFQSQPIAFQGPGLPSSAFGPMAHHTSPVTMNTQGYQQPSIGTNMNMNMLNRNNMMNDNRYMQAQMMYNRSPLVHPYTSYYQSPHYPIYYPENADYGAQMSNDESPENCAIM